MSLQKLFILIELQFQSGVAAMEKLDVFSARALGNICKLVSATFWATPRYKRCNTALGFGCKSQCLCVKQCLLMILQPCRLPWKQFTQFLPLFSFTKYVIVISLQVMSGQLCQTQASVCSLFVSVDLIVTGMVLLSSWHSRECVSSLSFLFLKLFYVHSLKHQNRYTNEVYAMCLFAALLIISTHRVTLYFVNCVCSVWVDCGSNCFILHPATVLKEKHSPNMFAVSMTYTGVTVFYADWTLVS